MKAKTGKKKIVLAVDDSPDYHEILHGYQTPLLKKVEEDRNKVIPHYVMEAIKSAFPQKKLSNFFEEQALPTMPAALKINAPSLEDQADSKDKPGLEAHVEQKVEKQQDPSEMQQQLVQDLMSAATLEKLIGTAAVNISREVKANFIITIEKGSSDTSDLMFDEVKVVIFKQVKSTYQRYTSYLTKMKKQQVGSVLPVKDLLMEAVNKKYIGKGDKIMFIGGDSMGTWLKGFFFIFDVDKVFFNISTHHLTEKIPADVLESIIGIAQEIGAEGREGRSIGTAFIVGNKDLLMKFSKPLLRINPFGSIPEESRKITDPEMRETIKNLAQLDGVFLIDETGTILTAGAYINIDQANMELPGLQGFGTRHRCTASITKMTDSIGVVVSASGGTVRIFKEGKQVMKLP